MRDPVPPAGADVVVMETTDGDRLPASMQVFLGPATGIFHRHPECCVPETARLLRESQDPSDPYGSGLATGAAARAPTRA
jgi:hypothetical protein